MWARVEPIEPDLKGDKKTLDIANKTGLPSCVTPTENMHIFLAIRKDTRGQNPPLQWTPPITCATQMKTSFEDKQLHSDDDRRYMNVILRAQPKFQGIPAFDKVEVWVQEDESERLYFAKYVEMLIGFC